MIDTDKRLLKLELQMEIIIRQNKHVIEKLDKMSPLVKENSWWIERIKLGFVLMAFSGLGLGIISWITKH